MPRGGGSDFVPPVYPHVMRCRVSRQLLPGFVPSAHAAAPLKSPFSPSFMPGLVGAILAPKGLGEAFFFFFFCFFLFFFMAGDPALGWPVLPTLQLHIPLSS